MAFSYYFWIMHNKPVSFLNSNNGSSILAFGVGPCLRMTGDVLDNMQSFIDKHNKEFIFVALSYDLKNDIEQLTSDNEDRVKFPKAILWVPDVVVKIEDDKWNYVQGCKTIENEDYINFFMSKQSLISYPAININFEPRTSVEDYLKNVNALKEEIQQGNIYEVNYCQEYFAKNVELDNPLEAYFKLNEITQAPYSTFFSFDEFTVLSGSPESYIRKKGNRIISSPIKGTRRRGETKEEDEFLKDELFNDQKERSENVMIVDLVRNDLSRIATRASVKVEELMKIYSFETVHQMISTISCEVDDEVSFTDILKATYPMGSMTGAPKISAMKLIEKHEEFQRGIYSGSIGYISPGGDFDLNVIIRTLVFNSKEKYISCSVGGAITIQSSAESEYQECLVQVQGILERMNKKN